MTEGKPPKTFRANSEAEVWTKFRPELRRSFFTTEIEDLLEGKNGMMFIISFLQLNSFVLFLSRYGGSFELPSL